MLKFLEMFTNAFGFEWLTPKCHWLLHLPETLKSHGRLLNCFVLERKRRVPKRYATELANTSGSASKPLLSECVAHHLSSLNRHSFNYEVGLVDGRTAPRRSRRLFLDALQLDGAGVSVLTAKDARFSRLGLCRQNDVVLLKDGGGVRAARAQLHCAVDDETVSAVQPLEFHRRTPGTSLVTWKPVCGRSE